MPATRISTGNPHVNTILNGGFIARRPYLIIGPVGSGKTKLALEFLCDGVRRGERVLYVTLDEPPNELRINHRALFPELDEVYVFDAIPDIMQYDPTLPFIDVAEVRRSMAFSEVDETIRQSPELKCVEVTFSALEQTLKAEFARRSYTRLVIDSLTALEYFSMKGTDEMVGAQTFLRLLSDLGATTVLTVEAAVEEIESVERLLARGAIRLFRWDIDGRTLRALGIEKFRGSVHDVRLHPYDVGPCGLEIDLGLTISRDTSRVVLPTSLQLLAEADRQVPLARSVDIVRLVSDINYLAALGADVSPVQAELDLARKAIRENRSDIIPFHLGLARAIVNEVTIAQRKSTTIAPPPKLAVPGTAVESNPRVSIGVPGLDRMMGGGLIPGRPYLVTGGPGTGKTLLGLTFLAEGLRRGEEVLLVAVDEPPGEILENIRSTGWDLSKVRTLDANPGTRRIKGMGDVLSLRTISDMESMGEVSVKGRRPSASGEISLQSIHQKLKQGMAPGQFARVLVDSITTIRRLSIRSVDDLQTRRTEVQSLLRFLSERGATTLVTAMQADPLTLTPEEILTRGEILLTRKWIGDHALRFAKVVRMRGSSHDPEQRPFAITSDGLFLE
ncbi:MAG: ATPase domain-containing protein [Thermoplasmata archaeon]